jgi:capsular exopolysaccharide synthesis family protein
MSRIHELLNKAEREGRIRHTFGAVAEQEARRAPAGRAAVAPPSQVERPDPGFVEGAPSLVASATGVYNGMALEFDPLLVAVVNPGSLAGEQYRALRTRITQAERGRGARSLLVTSPGKGDGKSVTCANLACSMAQEFQRRVVIVDADLRRPRLHALFGLPAGPGLAEVLLGAVELEDVLVPVPDSGLLLLPAGTPPARPAELLGSSAMRHVLETLRAGADRILVDTPPVSPLADVGILAPLVDAVLLVVRAAVTTKPAIEAALTTLDSSRVLGLVLNEARTRPAAEEPGYRYYATA